jgi:hypothetical protein
LQRAPKTASPLSASGPASSARPPLSTPPARQPQPLTPTAQVSYDGTNFITVDSRQCYIDGLGVSDAGTAITATAVTGRVFVNTWGAQQVRLNITAVASGTANVTGVGNALASVPSAIIADTNQGQKVDVTRIQGTVTVAGTVAHDSPDSGNPIKVGGKASSSTPTPVAGGDRVDAWLDEYGAQVVRQMSRVASNALNVDEETVTIDTTGMASVTIQTVNSAFSGTLVAEGSVDGSTWRFVQHYSYSGLFVTSDIQPSNQLYQVDSTPFASVRVRASAYTSGSVLVTLLAQAHASTEFIARGVHLVDTSGNSADLSNGGLQTVGNVPHDSGDTGNPVKIGGKASATAPADVTASDRVNAWLLLNGAQATALTAAGALIGGDATNGLDVDVTRLPALAAGDNAVGRVKITDGTTVATVRELGTNDAMNVAIVDGAGDQVTSFGGGTEYTEGATDASITGSAILWEDTSDTLRPVSAATPLPVGDAGGSLTVDGTVAVSGVGGTVAVTQSGTWDEVGINDSGNSITVDNGGTFAVQAASAGDVAHDTGDSGSPVKVGFKASSALPTAVANSDRANGISDLYGRQLTAHIDPAMQVHRYFNATTQQTGVDVWDPTASTKIAITSIVIGAYGTTAGRVILWFGDNADTTFTAGTDQVVLAASFAPSSTSKPGLVYTPAVPIYCTTVDRELHITTDAALSIDVTVEGYEWV